MNSKHHAVAGTVDNQRFRQPDVALAARQHNRIARWQLEHLGIEPSVIEYRLATERYIWVDRCVYSIGPPLKSRLALYMTAVLASGEAAVLNYRSGADLWDMRVRRLREIEVSVPTKRRSRRDILRHYGVLLPEEKTVRFGVPTATMQRVVFDLASVMDRDELQSVLEQAEHAHMDFTPVLAMMARQPRRKGVRLLRELAPRIRPVDPKSWLESDLAPFLISLGAPEPLRNWQIETSKGLEEVDFYYPTLKLIIEGDGYAYHGGASNLTRDHQKDRRLRAAGFRVERVTYDELHYDTAALAAFLTSLFAAVNHAQR
jgi:hypothetical protein